MTVPDRKRTLDASQVRRTAADSKVDHTVLAEIVQVLDELVGTPHAVTGWNRIVRADEDGTWQVVPDERNIILRLIQRKFVTVDLHDPQPVPEADRERIGPNVFPMSVTAKGRTALAHLSIP
jgi:hypothetical protein